jgi:hypothetical protein
VAVCVLTSLRQWLFVDLRPWDWLFVDLRPWDIGSLWTYVLEIVAVCGLTSLRQWLFVDLRPWDSGCLWTYVLETVAVCGLTSLRQWLFVDLRLWDSGCLWTRGPKNRSSIPGRTNVFPFIKTSREILRSSQLSIQSVTEEISLKVKRPGNKAISGNLHDPWTVH